MELSERGTAQSRDPRQQGNSGVSDKTRKPSQGKVKMELDETSHILQHQHGIQHVPKWDPFDDPHIPDTPESSKSDLHQLIEEDDGKKNKNRSTIPMASFNFINSIIGSGIIGMPYAIKEAGFGLGILLVLVVTVVTDYSLVLLIHGGELSNTNTYQDVMRAAFGRPGFVILTIMQFLYPMIAMISYNVIIGDTITKIVVRIGGPDIRYTIVARREFIIAAVTLVVTLPLSLYRNISRLSRVSLASIVFIVFIICVMIGKGFSLPTSGFAIVLVLIVAAMFVANAVRLDVPPTDDAWQFANSGVTTAIGIMAFAYMCHHNSFLIYDSLLEPTEKRWGIVTHVSVLVSMACTLVLGITCYATFTGDTQGDVLENYCQKDDLMNVARFLFACTIMLTFPIECFVTREVVENAVFAFTQPPPLWRHIIVTIVIVIISVAVSLSTDCLGIVLELNGVMNAAPLAYIFPALCVMKLQNDRLLCVKNIPMIITALFGLAVAVIGLIMVIIEIANGVKCSHGEEPDYCKTWPNLVFNSSHYSNTTTP